MARFDEYDTPRSDTDVITALHRENNLLRLHCRDLEREIEQLQIQLDTCRKRKTPEGEHAHAHLR